MIDRPLRWTARSAALYILMQARKKEAFVQDLLDAAFRDVPLSAVDRGLATQLVYGVFRRRGTLDGLLRHVVSRPPREVEPLLWEALRLGVFQLVYLSRIPAYSALNETVELAVDFGAPRAKGFLNGSLRALTRLLTDETIAEPGPNAIPMAPGEFRRLTERAFPDPAVRPVEYASVGLSLPDWLVRRWLARWSWDEVIRLGFWFADQPRLWLRINITRISREDYLAKLAASTIPATAGDHPQAVAVDASVPIRELPGYADGWLVVQDPSAMLVASALNPQPGWRILDLCAAPGGKATHLAELANDQARIVACDRDAKRLEPLTATIARLGLNNIEVITLKDNDDPPGAFDAALVDVPCSNTGVLGRRPEARWRLSEKEIARLVPLQTRLLARACRHVKPGGVIVYSTCSIEPEENANVIAAALQADKRLRLEAEQWSTPGQPADGGYWARLRIVN